MKAVTLTAIIKQLLAGAQVSSQLLKLLLTQSSSEADFSAAVAQVLEAHQAVSHWLFSAQQPQSNTSAAVASYVQLSASGPDEDQRKRMEEYGSCLERVVADLQLVQEGLRSSPLVLSMIDTILSYRSTVAIVDFDKVDSNAKAAAAAVCTAAGSGRTAASSIAQNCLWMLDDELQGVERCLGFIFLTVETGIVVSNANDLPQFEDAATDTDDLKGKLSELMDLDE